MYGILKNPNNNTGIDSELLCSFSAPLELHSNEPTFTNETLNLRRIATKKGTQRWELTANISADADMREFFVRSVISGHHTATYIRVPQLVDFKRVKSNSILVNSISASAGSTQLTTDLASVKLPVGEFITIGSDPKVYLVKDVLSTTVDIYTIFPELKIDAPVHSVIKYGDRVTMRAFFDNNTINGIRYEDGVLANPGSITFIEEL